MANPSQKWVSEWGREDIPGGGFSPGEARGGGRAGAAGSAAGGPGADREAAGTLG